MATDRTDITLSELWASARDGVQVAAVNRMILHGNVSYSSIASALRRGILTDDIPPHLADDCSQQNFWLNAEGAIYRVRFAGHEDFCDMAGLGYHECSRTGWAHVSHGVVRHCCKLTHAQKRALDIMPGVLSYEPWCSGGYMAGEAPRAERKIPSEWDKALPRKPQERITDDLFPS